MRTKDNEKLVIGTGFERAFTLRMPDRMLGRKIRKFGCCHWHDDHAWDVIYSDGKFWLVHYDSRDNGFKEIDRELLPSDTLATTGYHAEERDQWETLAAILERKGAEYAKMR